MRTRRGFTIIEILVAIVILAVLALGVARFSASFASSLATSTIRIVASGVASDRMQLIRADPRYNTLQTLYGAGGSADTTGFPDYPHMRRVTVLARDQSGVPARDRTTVTVTVSDPSLSDAVKVTSVIASP